MLRNLQLETKSFVNVGETFISIENKVRIILQNHHMTTCPISLTISGTFCSELNNFPAIYSTSLTPQQIKA